MNNENNINPNIEKEPNTVAVTQEPVPTVPVPTEVAPPTITPSEPTALPEMIVSGPTVQEVSDEVQISSENISNIAAMPTVQTPIQTPPETVTSVPVTVPEITSVPVIQEAVTTPIATPVGNTNIPTITTQPPIEIANNNFADFQMPETPSTAPVIPETTPIVQATSSTEGEIVGEVKKSNKTLYIILGIIIGIIIIIGIGGFIITKMTNKNIQPTSNENKDISCSYDNVIRTINVHSEAIIRVDDSGDVSKIDYTHTYTASDQSALNDKHLSAIEYCTTPGAETKLGKDTKCELKDGKIIITAYLEAEANKTSEDYKTALTTQGFVCS